MLYLFVVFYLVMFVMNFVVVNVLFWWSVFVVSVVLFIWMCKISGSVIGIVNYFIIQESMSLMFLFFSGSIIQFIVLMVKSGVSPLHLWIFSVGLDLSGFMLMWFLVVQKLPFVPVLLYLFVPYMMAVYVLGLLVCHLQYLGLGNDSSLVMVSSTESFSWLLMMVCYGYWSFILMAMFYMALMAGMMGSLEEGMSGCLGWELTLLFMNFPMGLVFLVKFYVLSLVSLCNMLVVVLFISVVMVYMCVMFWMISLMMASSGVWSSKLMVYCGVVMMVMVVV